MTTPEKPQGGDNENDFSHVNNLPDKEPASTGRKSRVKRLGRFMVRHPRGVTTSLALVAAAVGGAVFYENVINPPHTVSPAEKAKQRALEARQQALQTAKTDQVSETTLFGAIGSRTSECGVYMSILGPGTRRYYTPNTNGPYTVVPKGTEIPVFEPANFRSFGSSLAGWSAYSPDTTGVINRSSIPVTAEQIAKKEMWFRDPNAAGNKSLPKTVSDYGPTVAGAHKKIKCSFSSEGQMTVNNGVIKATAHQMNSGEPNGFFFQTIHADNRLTQDAAATH